MMRTVAEGYWCTKCEVFEDEDQIDLLNEETCVACGCDPAEHEACEVVTK
jgi:hypothetical protein